MPSESEIEYGRSTAWQPEPPRLKPFSLVVSWLALAAASTESSRRRASIHVVTHSP